MKYYKDNSGAVFAYAADGSQDAFISSDLIEISEEEANIIRFPKKTKAQLKSAELNALTAVFNINKNDLNVAWLAAAVAGGANEDAIKAMVLADIDELQTQYNDDVIALKLKYA